MSLATSQQVAPSCELHVWNARHYREHAGPDVRSFASRSILREVLAAYVETAPADLRFAAGLNGKPFLTPKADGPDLRFNLSHSGERLLIAIAAGREVGVDVQHIDSLGAAEGLVRFLAPAERELLEGLPAQARRQVILQLWAAKEAALKATGEGVCRSLRELDVSSIFATGTATVWRPVVGGSETREWTVQPVNAGPGYAAAVAIEGGPAVGVTVLDWPDSD